MTDAVGPIIDDDGTQSWYQDDKLHRLDGPAVMRADGSQVWYQDDKLHRLDGPAVIHADGDQYWYQERKLHRLDGPAVIYGKQQWFRDGEEIVKPEYSLRSASVDFFGPIPVSYLDFGGVIEGLTIRFTNEEDAVLWFLSVA